MAASTLAGVISAVAGVFTAIALVITAVAGAAASRRASKRLDEVQRTTEIVHTIVNQERTNRLNYQRALIRALQAHDINVPVDQSVEDAPTE